MPLAHWLYGSSSDVAADLASHEVASILAVSEPRNGALNVTGALIFTGARFAQYLEGSPSGVAELKMSIIADPRHHEVITISEGPVDKRIFPDWSLAYAGHSVFVQGEVERAIEAAQTPGAGERERLVQMIRAFAVSG